MKNYTEKEQENIEDIKQDYANFVYNSTVETEERGIFSNLSSNVNWQNEKLKELLRNNEVNIGMYMFGFFTTENSLDLELFEIETDL